MSWPNPDLYYDYEEEKWKERETVTIPRLGGYPTEVIPLSPQAQAIRDAWLNRNDKWYLLAIFSSFVLYKVLTNIRNNAVPFLQENEL